MNITDNNRRASTVQKVDTMLNVKFNSMGGYQRFNCLACEMQIVLDNNKCTMCAVLK